MNIQLDDGVQFGLGAFETIALQGNTPLFLDWHLERLRRSLGFLHISQKVSAEEVIRWIGQHAAEKPGSGQEQRACKLMVSEKNKIFSLRKNPYTEAVKARGFRLAYSPVLRNETSPLVYHKTMNYGDNILEKRRTKNLPIDEVVFLNTRGELCEGSTTNLFFVKQGQILTPKQSCGLLPGILRRYVLQTFSCQETVLYPGDAEQMEECFVTNSLIGILPVLQLGGVCYARGPVTERCMERYRKDTEAAVTA
ncbi:MAG: aminotransferase class IV [Lachnospiraceae bacterium]|jgi:4-amino-4-deoxychorismate lyase|nr:aminotransferase class IV [Lachnospiraceae bacterium]MCI1656001.1 aminotransferase class IV [Lachnospiraceae bacterium]MCI2194483.1 aminotransferase class IV [Lachnospiraceae bacterium]